MHGHAHICVRRTPKLWLHSVICDKKGRVVILRLEIPITERENILPKLLPIENVLLLRHYPQFCGVGAGTEVHKHKPCPSPSPFWSIMLQIHNRTPQSPTVLRFVGYLYVNVLCFTVNQYWTSCKLDITLVKWIDIRYISYCQFQLFSTSYSLLQILNRSRSA